MDLQLHITLYQKDGQERFKVLAFFPETGLSQDVTDQYSVVATEEEGTGRKGFMVMRSVGEAVDG
jgi:hypothetical protein